MFMSRQLEATGNLKPLPEPYCYLANATDLLLFLGMHGNGRI